MYTSQVKVAQSKYKLIATLTHEGEIAKRSCFSDSPPYSRLERAYAPTPVILQIASPLFDDWTFGTNQLEDMTSSLQPAMAGATRQRALSTPSDVKHIESESKDIKAIEQHLMDRDNPTVIAQSYLFPPPASVPTAMFPSPQCVPAPHIEEREIPWEEETLSLETVTNSTAESTASSSSKSPQSAGLESGSMGALGQHLLRQDDSTDATWSYSNRSMIAAPTTVSKRSHSISALHSDKAWHLGSLIDSDYARSSLARPFIALKIYNGRPGMMGDDDPLLDPLSSPSLTSSRSVSAGSPIGSGSDRSATSLQSCRRRSRSLPIVTVNDDHINVDSSFDNGLPTIPVLARRDNKRNMLHPLRNVEQCVSGATASITNATPTRLPDHVSDSTDSTLQTSSESILAIRRPQFPIRVSNGLSPSFSSEAQRRKMRWRYHFDFDLYAHCIVEPDIRCIQKVVWPYIRLVAPQTSEISVEYRTKGSYNKVYTIIASNEATGLSREYIFRVALPIYPYYKVESDVATTEFVRHSTSMPVPIIYAFDSADNELGFEWMLMEKVVAKPLYSVWDDIDYCAKEMLVEQLAAWNDQLARFAFDKIGSIYMRDNGSMLQFYIGPSIHCRLYEGDRLSQPIPRGPFDSLQAFYDSILEATEGFASDPRHSERLALEESATDEDVNSLRDGIVVEALSKLAEVPVNIGQRTVSESQERQTAEDAILSQADMDDRQNELDRAPRRKILAQVIEDLDIYRYSISGLCPNPPVSRPMTTMLVHPDLLMANIFVNDTGRPVAIIDWERVHLEPDTLVLGMPLFLQHEFGDIYYDALADGRFVPDARKITMNAIQLAEIRRQDEASYSEVLLRFDLTKLRTLYRETLEHLESPLYKVLDRDPDCFEQQLIQRVYWPEKPHFPDALDWVTDHLTEEWMGMTDDDERDLKED